MSMSEDLRSLKCEFSLRDIRGMPGCWTGYLGRRTLLDEPREGARTAFLAECRGVGSSWTFQRGGLFLWLWVVNLCFAFCSALTFPWYCLWAKSWILIFWHYLRSCQCLWIQILAFFIGRKECIQWGLRVQRKSPESLCGSCSFRGSQNQLSLLLVFPVPFGISLQALGFPMLIACVAFSPAVPRLVLHGLADACLP